MTVLDQTVERHTREAASVGALTATFSDVNVAQDDGAGSTGRYKMVATVALTSVTAGTVIERFTYGGVPFEPDEDGQVSAAGRPATRTFSAGEWPTGANAPEVTASNAIANAVVCMAVMEAVPDACLPAYGTGLVSDPLNRRSRGTRWNFSTGDAPLAEAAAVDLGAVHAVQIDVNDDLGQWFGAQEGSFYYQEVPDGDFDIRVNFGGIRLTEPSSAQGLLVWEDDDNHVTALRYSTGDGSGESFFSGDTTANSTNFRSNANPADDVNYTRITRVGDDFEVFHSVDGSTWTSRSSFTKVMTVNRVGFFLAKTGGGTVSAPKNFVHFYSNDQQREEETPEHALEFLSDIASSATSIELAFTEATDQGAGLVNLAIIAADDAAGAMAVGAGDELLAEGVIAGPDGIRYAVVGALTEVSGSTAGATIGASWAGAADASAAGLQFRVDALSAGGDVAVGTASETDTGQAIAPSRSVPVGTAAEVDTAATIDVSKAVAAGIAAEADQAVSTGPSKSATVGPATEDDIALPITNEGTNVVAGTASEADTATSITPSNAGAAGVAGEADQAQAIAPSKAVGSGTAEETDTALPIDVDDSAIAVGPATETDEAQPIAPSKAVGVGPATEDDSALAIGVDATNIEIGIGQETDQAQMIAPSKAGSVGTADETDQAIGVQPGRELPAGQAAETDEAIGATPSKSVAVGIAEEDDQAVALARPNNVVIGTAGETDTAVRITIGVPAPTIILKGQSGKAAVVIEGDNDVVVVEGSKD